MVWAYASILMTDPPPSTPTSPLKWDEDGQPRSRLFGDVYFSKDGGLEETRTVFLRGCGLPEAWAGRQGFTIGELGFGSGLNLVAALDLWRQTRPAGGRLNLFSIEAHPLTCDEARRALGLWPRVSDVAGLLLSRWPGRARGFHRVDLPELGAVLDLAVMDATAALEAWQGKADAWFLDGFAPALNPGMWSPALLALVAARSSPGARAATYTVAGAVRRGLAEAGFTVERQPGFGRKRERLEARLGDGRRVERAAPRVAIVGAGIAGASLARAFAAEGFSAPVFDNVAAGAGASGNPAALVTPRLDAGLGPGAALFAQAFARAGALYEAQGDAVIIARGALQLEAGERDARRFATIAASDLFEPGGVTQVGGAMTSARLGETVPAGLEIHESLVIEPMVVLDAWLPLVQRAVVDALQPMDGGGWRLLGVDGGVLAEADLVCLAAGVDCNRLYAGLNLQAVRGQASWVEERAVGAAVSFGGYVIATRTGVLFGATHDRDDTDANVREADSARNLASVAKTLPRLAGRLASAPVAARASLRATTRDYMPLAGVLGEPGSGLLILSGLGSRGFTLAPLLAEHVVAQALERPSPLPASLARLVDPARFEERARRAGV